MLEEYEKIDNIKLILNNLRHISCELESIEPSPMRLAKECYQLFLRMMAEALRGTANIAITGKPTKNRKHWYRQGNDPWKAIQKEDVEGCNKAWRYSEPLLETPQRFQAQEGTDIPPPDDYFLGFYDLLAMIQTPCFMLRYGHSAVVSVSDSQMKLFEWLHEEIRNEFEHFIPKALLASCDDCLHASEVCLHLTTDMLTKPNNIMPFRIEELQIKLHSVSISIAALRAGLNSGDSILNY